MKKQNGITLAALSIYVIVFILVIGIVATITSFYYDNVVNFDETTRSYAEINKVNMYFLQDIKQKGTTVKNLIPSSEDSTKYIGITLYNSQSYETHEYKLENNAIYRNGKIVCKDIKQIQFRIDDENPNIINIMIEAQGEVAYTKNMIYTINS